jgi:hypothetical protein
MIVLDNRLQRKVGKNAARFVSNAAANKRVKAVIISCPRNRVLIHGVTAGDMDAKPSK